LTFFSSKSDFDGESVRYNSRSSQHSSRVNDIASEIVEAFQVSDLVAISRGSGAGLPL
jgi:HD superfamily phosphodiesterase